MIKEIIASGKDIIEAKENARAALGAGPLDDVNFEVIHAGSRGIFGIIGVKPAQVRAFIEMPDPVERKRHEKPKKQRNERNEEKKHSPAQNKPKAKEEKKPEADKPKAQAIPETELSLTLKEVKEGGEIFK